MKRYFNAIRGLVLFFQYKKIFAVDMLKGKRVAVVGPASTAFNTNLGDYIDSFDFVLRVNKSAIVVDSGKFERDIGKRTDILFHSFFENTESGGGPLDFTVFERQGVRYLINPRNTFSGLRNTFNFYKKYLVPRSTYTLPAPLYREICKPLRNFRPTIGFTALMTALHTEFSELYITGFTFYQTPFGAGYRDQIQDPARAKAFINEQGIHNIDLEFEAFRNALKVNSGKVIKLENTLANIVRDISEPKK
jgi:hypothetical protein